MKSLALNYYCDRTLGLAVNPRLVAFKVAANSNTNVVVSGPVGLRAEHPTGMSRSVGHGWVLLSLKITGVNADC